MGKRATLVAAFAKLEKIREESGIDRRMTASYMRNMLRAHYDFQANRIIVANRLKLKADGTPQEGFEDYVAGIPQPAFETLRSSLLSLAEEEDNARTTVEAWVTAHPFYQHWLKDVKGLGPMLSAVILTEIDIVKAENVGKIWAYAGLSPGMSWGYENADKLDEAGKPVINEKTGKPLKYRKITETRVRQDRLTAGFLCPFNGFLRAKLIGVLAPSFIKSGNVRYRTFYENMKQRESMKIGTKQLGKDGVERDFYLGWAHNRALRYMIKMFLADLYDAWRKFEGLEVRVPYAEEYLGKKHHGPTDFGLPEQKGA